MTNRQYNRPPIKEALCEFKFRLADPSAGLMLPGRIYDRVKQEYDGTPREQAMVEANLTPSAGIKSLKVRQSSGKIQFPTRDGSRLLAVSSEAFSVHALPPYLGWEEFRGRLARALESYSSIANPEGVTRIGVRYIDQIHLGRVGGLAGASELVLLQLNVLPGHLPDPYAVFTRSEHLVDDVKILITVATVTGADGDTADPSLLIDIDVVKECSEDLIMVDDALDVADKLKAITSRTFESLITERARELFDEVED